MTACGALPPFTGTGTKDRACHPKQIFLLSIALIKAST
jgi:hypothetical protein